LSRGKGINQGNRTSIKIGEVSTMENRKWQRYIFLAIALVAAIWLGKYMYTDWKINEDKKIKNAKNDEEATKKQEGMNRLVNQMALKYNAIIDWPDRIPDNKRIPYTIEINKIMTGENRPILLYGWIEDIVNKNGKHIMMANGYLINSLTRLVLILECNLHQMNKIANSTSNGKYAIIAQVSEVQKQKYQEDESTTYRFIISGQCLDLIFVSEGSMQAEMLEKILRIP